MQIWLFINSEVHKNPVACQLINFLFLLYIFSGIVAEMLLCERMCARDEKWDRCDNQINDTPICSSTPATCMYVCAHITWWRVKEAANWNCSSLCVYAQHALLLLCICQRAAFDYIQLSESGSRAPQQREDLLLMLRARALSLSETKPPLARVWLGWSALPGLVSPAAPFLCAAVEQQIYTMRYVIT